MLLAAPLRAQDGVLDPETLPYVAVYRLVATADPVAAEASGAPLTPTFITQAGMSLNGQLLAWVSEERPEIWLYVSDFAGAQLSSSKFPRDAGDVWEMETTNSGVFLRSSLGAVWHSDASASLSPWFTGSPAVSFVREIAAPAGGELVYVIADRGADANDLFSLPGQGPPLKLADSADIPCPPIQGCQGVWTLSNLDVSADASVLALMTTGFFVRGDDGIDRSIDHDEALTLTGGGWRYQTYDLPLGPILGPLSLSPDGNMLVLHGAVQETPSVLTRRWLALATGGGPMAQLARQDFNVAAAALNGDGSLALLDLSQLAVTDGSFALDLFPTWNVQGITLAATNDLAMTPDGRQIAFRTSTTGFYTGVLNDPAALAGAPIAITGVSLFDGVLTVTTTGPVDRMTLDAVQNGRLLTEQQPAPWRCAGPPRDDGQPPDTTAADGHFTTTCARQSGEAMSIRLGAATAGQGWVIVMDVPVGGVD